MLNLGWVLKKNKEFFSAVLKSLMLEDKNLFGKILWGNNLKIKLKKLFWKKRKGKWKNKRFYDKLICENQKLNHL